MDHNDQSRDGASPSLVYQQVYEALSRQGPLPSPDEANGPWTSILHEDAHHSTALEGNTLTGAFVTALLEDGRAPGNKDLREYLEVVGYAHAARWVYAQIRAPGEGTTFSLVTANEVLHLHELALAPLLLTLPSPRGAYEGPGAFRSHDQRPRAGQTTPPSWVEVPAAVATWIASLGAIPDSEVLFEDIARAHARFASIAPFSEGNGRVSRLVLNVLLVRLGYPPAIFYLRDRARYLRAMHQSDRGDPSLLAELIARSLTDTLARFAPAAASNRGALLPLAALATPELKTTALRTAIERGRLHAQKGPDGKWRSSRAWIEEYLNNKYTRPR